MRKTLATCSKAGTDCAQSVAPRFDPLDIRLRAQVIHREWKTRGRAFAAELEFVELWELVHVTDDCWLWLGDANGAGYGQFKGRMAAAVMLEHAGRGTGRRVKHRCEIPNCVNPQHLQWGTGK